MMDTNGKFQEIWKFSEMSVDIFIFLLLQGSFLVQDNYATYYPFPFSVLFWKITTL